MRTIGQRLQEARDLQGVRVLEAADATRVRAEYLQLLEEDRFDDIKLPSVYKRGFIKIYARYLRLDPEELLLDYPEKKKESFIRRSIGPDDFFDHPPEDDPESPAAGAVPLASSRGHDGSQANDRASGDGRPRKILWAAIGVLSIAVIVFAFWLAFGDAQPPEGNEHTTPATTPAHPPQPTGPVMREFSLKVTVPGTRAKFVKIVQTAPQRRVILNELLPANVTKQITATGPLEIATTDNPTSERWTADYVDVQIGMSIFSSRQRNALFFTIGANQITEALNPTPPSQRRQ